MNKAIVFSPGSAGLSMIQSFGVRGIPCISMDCSRLPGTRRIGTYSKYAQFLRCPDPLDDEGRFIDFLYEKCKRETEKPVLFPTVDHWAVAMARHRGVLDEVAFSCVGSIDSVDLFIDKPQFYRRGEEREWMTPTLWSLEELEAGKKLSSPIAAKPVSKLTFVSTDARGSVRNISLVDERLRLTVIRSRLQWEKFAAENRQHLDGLLFQDFVEGLTDSMYSVGVYADRNSEIKGLFTGKKLRGYPALYGDCTVGTSHPVPDEVLENTFRIIKETAYSGIAEFEYKKDAETGAFYLIEVNPRPWSWIGITERCQDNIALAAYNDLTGRMPAVGDRQSPSNGGSSYGDVLYVKVLQDLIHSLFLYKKDHQPWAKSFGEWKQSIKGEQIVFAEWNAADWPAGLTWIVKDLVLAPVKRFAKNVLRLREK